MSPGDSIHPEHLLAIHQQIRTRGQPLISILTDQHRLDAKAFLYDLGQCNKSFILAAPSPDHQTTIQSYRYHTKRIPKTEHYLALHFDLDQALVLANQLFAHDISIPAVTFASTAQVIQMLFAEKQDTGTLKQILQGLVPIGNEQQTIFNALIDEDRIRPVLRSAYEGLLYFILEARRETRGRFKANQHLKSLSTSGLMHFEVDLLSPEDRLIIEIDGKQHDSLRQGRLDEKKAKALEKEGYRLMRFSTDVVAQQPEAVWQTIYQTIHAAENNSNA